MTDLSDHDIERIAEALAPRLVDHVKQTNHNFWIDPEEHYQDHFRMRELAKTFTPEFMKALTDVAGAFNKGRGIFWGIFLTMVVVGAIGFAFWSFITGAAHK